MKDFEYLNHDRLEELSNQIYGEGDRFKEIYDINSVKVYKFLLAYCIVYRKKINKRVYEHIKRQSINFSNCHKNRIFFEKVETYEIVKDAIYFMNYMKEMEKDPGFLGTWQIYFIRSA